MTLASQSQVANDSSEEATSALQAIYNRLHIYHGPQYWWPGDSPFEVIAGAILTQNTSWANVELAIASLRGHDTLSPRGILAISEDDLAALIRPAGYYNTKARKLKVFVDYLFDKHGGRLSHLFAADIDVLRDELLSIWGIGEETADSIILYAAGKPSFVVDAYTRRVFSRLGLCGPDEKYGSLRNFFMANLTPDPELYNEYHALIVRHGKGICSKRRPVCRCCPLETLPCVCASR